MFSYAAFQDLQATWTNAAENFDVTVTEAAYTEGSGSSSLDALTSSLGGHGIPSATKVTFVGVQASSSAFTFTYNLVNPNQVTVNLYDGGGPLFTAQRATVTVTMGNQAYVEPNFFSESGPAGFNVTKLKWSDWGGTTAIAHGTVSVQGSTPEPVEVELTGNDDVGTYQGLIVILNGELPTTYSASELNNDFSAG